MESNKQHIQTIAVHAGQQHEESISDVILPIHLSTTFERKKDGSHNTYNYTRSGNPNRDMVENKIDANMVKYYEIQNAAKRDWVYKVNIIDYIYTKSKEKDYPVDSISAQEN